VFKLKISLKGTYILDCRWRSKAVD